MVCWFYLLNWFSVIIHILDGLWKVAQWEGTWLTTIGCEGSVWKEEEKGGFLFVL